MTQNATLIKAPSVKRVSYEMSYLEDESTQRCTSPSAAQTDAPFFSIKRDITSDAGLDGSKMSQKNSRVMRNYTDGWKILGMFYSINYLHQTHMKVHLNKKNCSVEIQTTIN